MKKLIRNKKGVDSFTFLLTIFAILVLGFILVGLTMKYNKLNNTIGEAGSSASSILSAYASADRALLYLDNAVGMSMQSSIYDLAYNGFYLGGAPSKCGLNNNYQRWSEGLPDVDSSEIGLRMCNPLIEKCIPASYDANFKSAFLGRLNGQVSAYNNGSEVNLSGDGYELQLGKTEVLCPDKSMGCGGRNEGPFQLVGKTDKPMNMSSRRVNYTIMPSFRENADVDLAGHFERVTGKAFGLIAALEANPSMSEADITKILADYNKAENDLEWKKENYATDCAPLCDTGESCQVCITCCSEDEGEGGTGGEGGDGTGGGDDGGGESKCSTVCVPGKTAQMYCDYNLALGVKIVADAYKLKGDKKGYVGFVAENGGTPEVKKYEYRFSFNWVELQPSTTCIPIGAGPTCG